MSTTADTAEIFERYRALLFSIAYRMLASVADAEDVVQEAFVRWIEAAPGDVDSPKAYLSTIVVRLCLDEARSARARREVYTGPWLPEPLGTAGRPDLTARPILAETLSYAFLIVLETLPPLERAVFLLRDVFDYGYDEIAAIVGKTAANCRQILHRARARLGERRPRYEVSHEQQTRLTEQFMRASTAGDMQGLLGLLSDDIAFVGDGGGVVPAARMPVRGPDHVARGMLGGIRRLGPDVTAGIVEVNGAPAIVGRQHGQCVGVIILEFAGDRVSRVYSVLNPAKLTHLPAPPA